MALYMMISGWKASFVLLAAIFILTGCGMLAGGPPGNPPLPNSVKVWFVKKSSSELSAVERSFPQGGRIEKALQELLHGPLPKESKQGLGTEIPRGTILLEVKESPAEVEINLSQRFASGGGSGSFQARLEQLSRTVRSAESNRPVFLNIEGERLTVTQGEGIEVKQPINR